MSLNMLVISAKGGYALVVLVCLYVCLPARRITYQSLDLNAKYF